MENDYFSHLSSEEKHILKDKGTEAPFSGEYNDFFEAGIFVCRACENPLYESNSKFNSGCGWPSFDEGMKGSIKKNKDLSGGRIRTEICCKKCDGHLGHVFEGEQITAKNTRHCVNSLSIKFIAHNNLEVATFGGGCFWHVGKTFRETKGVCLASVGYMGGNTLNPTYHDICKGNTNHAEVVHLYFNSEIISYSDLLKVFWSNHNPTTLNQQGLDVGTQYRSVIFYQNNTQKEVAETSLFEQKEKWKKEIVTQITSAEKFYRAEEYHQNYLNKNNLGSCGL
ncbi:MAG TPA: bifunctional methionine sulfoxide reductase B/A protein [Flavobacteriales bacterium]|nr:bifunctional methionine sulfoxide reductase B/A protein [Flavobacteriales bacterium]